jgi:two-component system copper resistance phosphate regulon response regulator CusR
MKILLIEDDPKISSFVKISLENNECFVDTASDSTDGEKFSFTRNYDVIILDIGIPGLNGLDLCKKIRSRKITTPVLMLMSVDSVEKKFTEAYCGADDFLVKPFIFQELFARVKALDRRAHDSVIIPVLKVLDLELNLISKKVRREGIDISLTPTEFRILELLMNNRDKVFNRIQIAESIWGNSFDSGTNVINVHINALRKKIDKNFTPKLIQTKKGFGYVLSSES